MIKKLFLTTIIALFLLFPFSTMAQTVSESGDDNAQEQIIQDIPAQAFVVKNEYHRGKVVEIVDEGVFELGETSQPYQNIKVEIIEGGDKGKQFDYQYQLANQPKTLDKQKLQVGQKVVVVKVVLPDGTADYYVSEVYRMPVVIWVFLLFLLLAIICAGWKGVTSIIGLGFSLLVIVKFIVPQIVAGHSPLLITVVGGLFIMIFSLYFAHGFNKRTTIALAGTSITIVLAAIMSIGVVSAAKLFGLGSEEAITLLQGSLKNIDLQGLFLSAILIGALGVLDDITTAQSATVEEIHRANPKLDWRELYKRGSSVGREHISSLVNTLALAYVGASLPLMLIFTKTDFPVWVLLNSEFLVEEIMRTLIGSIVLIIAVPVTSYLAARAFENDPVDHRNDKEVFHSHSH